MSYLRRNKLSQEKIPAGLPRIDFTAVRKVVDQFPIPKECPKCSGDIELVNNEAIYGREYGAWPYVYACLPCDVYVGLHSNTHLPLGTPADRETRGLRSRGHELLSLFQRKRNFSRRDCYRWLAEKMQQTTPETHFGLFTAEQCHTAIEFLRRELAGDE